MKLALIRDQTQVKFYYQNNVITNQRNKLCAKYISVHWSTGEGFPTAVFAAGEGQVLFEQVLSVKSFLFFICLLICFSMMILAHPPWLPNASHLATGRYAHKSFRLWVSCAHKSSRLRVSSLNVIRERWWMIKGDTQASLREYGWSEEQTLTKVMTEKPRLRL